MPVSAFRAAASVAALAAVVIAGCQMKAVPTASNFITADSTFVIHSIDRYDSGQLNGTDSMIVVIKATYTNPEALTETISADKFYLVDQTLEADYGGLSGGDINIPEMTPTSLATGKSVDITIGFRVPAAMANGRLTYRP
jgi:hypothetical protein